MYNYRVTFADDTIQEVRAATPARAAAIARMGETNKALQITNIQQLRPVICRAYCKPEYRGDFDDAGRYGKGHNGRRHTYGYM